MSLLEKDDFFRKRDLCTSFDALTKVLNREIVFAYMQHLIENNIPFASLIIDIDNFKYVNDTYGHMVGDKVIHESAQNMVRCIGEFAAVGRFGGDEFFVVVPNISDYNDVWALCRKINMNNEALKYDELCGTNITFTIGLTRFPIDGVCKETLLLKADKALYRGKQKGRNCFIIYLAEKHDHMLLKSSADTKMNNADRHVMVINMLTHSGHIANNIKSVLHFFSSNLMIDYISLQSNTKMCDCVIYPVCKFRDVSYIPGEVLNQYASSTGIVKINNVNTLMENHNGNLYQYMVDQHCGASVICKVETNEACYGYLRAETTNQKGRIWQNEDVDLLVVCAKVLGLVLHYNQIDLDDIF